MSKTALAVLIALVVFGALIYTAMQGISEHSCEVCVEFNGRTQCREAKGPTKEEAQRTAQDNACAFLARGMTESMSCGRVVPKSTKCR